MMMTIDQIREYLERVIAERRLSGDRVGLKELQIAAGFLMAAADYAGDKDSALRFRVLAAEAANKREELTGD
ncbi:MAG: hypothetical protein ABI901_00065 [Roseiflexaceae bacterium]